MMHRARTIRNSSRSYRPAGRDVQRFAPATKQEEPVRPPLVDLHGGAAWAISEEGDRGAISRSIATCALGGGDRSARGRDAPWRRLDAKVGRNFTVTRA